MPKTSNQSKSNQAKLNETGKRKQAERRQNQIPVASERRKVQRRRQIDPTTCEREYSDPEIEFMHALDEYKRTSGRMFPTCSEILEVLVKLGYRKNGQAGGNGQFPVVFADNEALTGHSNLELS
ncbi:MAG: hypothetical protein ACK493_10520 [Planctomycetota bacterium]|jgi:hypothetical protein|nr:hypothetical protein [Blastopirellula sp.]